MKNENPTLIRQLLMDLIANHSLEKGETLLRKMSPTTKKLLKEEMGPFMKRINEIKEKVNRKKEGT